MAEGTLGGTPISELPASSFAYCEPGDGAVSTRCHFPIRDKGGKADAAHVRNALARLAGSPFEAKARPKVEAAAKELGIGEPGQKAMSELKAADLTSKELDAWLSGERSRRIVVIPFGGPLPGGKAGLDLDGEYFDEETDLYGPFPGLRASRERIVDWHHDQTVGIPDHVPSMKGAIMGKIILDEGPSTLTTDEGTFDGVLADFWANAGEQRRMLIKALQKRGSAIFGSSQAVAKATRIADDGHIELWPVYRHTLSTSPQNTYAVVPPLKAILMADLPFDEIGLAALRAALAGLEDLGDDLRETSSGGDDAAKARRLLSDALPEFERTLERMRASQALRT